MCIRDRSTGLLIALGVSKRGLRCRETGDGDSERGARDVVPVSYTHLRAHETVLDLVCRLLLEKKK